MIIIHDLQSGYRDVCTYVLDGTEVSPRGKLTKEVLGETIRVQDITRSLPLHIGRKCNAAIGAVEAVQLIGGFSDPDLMCRISPNMEEFLTRPSDEYQILKPFFHGAYGPRLAAQLSAIQMTLEKDVDTRQAVATIWDPRLDLGVKQPDLPCTVSLHFLIRKNRLILHTHMRSNDVWWGLAYDVFQFTQLQLTMANMLGIEAGPYYHHTTSLHLYEKDWGKVDGLHQPQEIMTPLWGFANDDRAWNIGHGLVGVDEARTDTERWYAAQLGRYMDGGS